MGTVQQLRSVRRACAMVAVTAVMLPAAHLHQTAFSDASRKRRAFRQWEQRWAEQQLRTFGMHIRTVGQMPTGPEQARLVVANHRSPVDILIAIARIGGCVLSREDLARWPLLGPAARAAGTIFVDRQDRRSGAQAIRAIHKRLREGRQVIVFPEGATFCGDEVQPFLAGAFAAARGLSVEILPIGFAYPSGTEFVNEPFTEHMLRTARRAQTKVGMAIGQPFLAAGHRDLLASEAQARVQGLVRQARGVLG